MRSPLIWILCSATVLGADALRFADPDAWSMWDMPYGLVEFGTAGQLQLVKYRKDINAVANASLFTHSTRSRGEAVAGGIWKAGSNPDAAERTIDGDPATFWQAAPNDALDDWFVQVDLGRAVLAEEIRLTFPDKEGARPYRQFAVFTATGITSDPLKDVFIYRPVYFTTRPNEATSIAIPLSFDLLDTAQVVDRNLDIEPADIANFRLVQYINFIVEDFDPEGALAEIEVVAVGDNISLGTLNRGTVLDGLTARGNEGILDGDMNTGNAIIPTAYEGRVRSWQEQGTWFYINLGATFWLDELFIYVVSPREGTVGSLAGPPRGFNFLHSDGTRLTGSELPTPEAFDFATLIDQPDLAIGQYYGGGLGFRYLRYAFAPRRIRYLFWHPHTTQGWASRWYEMMLFSPGHPARVVLRSPFINLGETAGDGRPKVISKLSWDADLPPGTRVELRSRSGNTQREIYTFFNKIGEVVTEEKWLSSPKVLRGPVDTTVVVSEDWDEWSEEYTFSGEAFKSQSPRRFVQLEMILSTNDPDVAPEVSSLSVEYEAALLQGALGRVAPRNAQPNEDTRFTYTLAPAGNAEDPGFDLMRFALSSAASDIDVWIGGAVVEPTFVDIRADSLHIGLPFAVTSDSVQISFTTRVVQNATLFGLDLGSSERPGLWQSVEAETRRANIVMLPALADATELIDELSLSSPVLTPNGDGANDEVEIRFVTFKVTPRTPRVLIYDLAGRPVSELPPPTVQGATYIFSWTGRDAAGNLVRPGAYLYRIDLGADAGVDTTLRTVAVAY
ncbi:MAG: hypothetical protein OXI58_07025 [Gemmatimonadota bacterium]|nr:hypothetical protein [Gemmatimonadota bacterium]